MLNAQESDIAAMLHAIVRSLVDRPEKVEITSQTQESGTTFRVFVDATDVGKVIGMNGRTARALRTILGANASRLKRSLSLDIQGHTQEEAKAAETQGSLDSAPTPPHEQRTVGTPASLRSR